jgi:hypothetical protein
MALGSETESDIGYKGNNTEYVLVSIHVGEQE